jgi:DNA-directed RNA polymerase specialized sigma24 family protein
VRRARERTGRALSGYAALLAPLVEMRHPEDDVGERQLAQRVREKVVRALGSLQPRYRRALELRLVEGRPRQECADAMEVRLGTFDVLLLRALRAFRREWDAGANGREEVSG